MWIFSPFTRDKIYKLTCIALFLLAICYVVTQSVGFILRAEVFLFALFGLVTYAFFQKIGKLKLLLVIFGVAYSVFILSGCFVYLRAHSWDGSVTYFNPMYLMYKNIFDPSAYLNPLRPFVIQAFLALVWKLTSLRVVSLTFGVAGLLGLFFSYLFYCEIGLGKSKALLGVFVLATTPILLSLMMEEFKLDTFLFMFGSILLLAYVKYLRTFSFIYLVIMAGTVTMGFFIKLTFLLISVPLILHSVFIDFSNSAKHRLISQWVVRSLLVGILCIVPPAYWVFKYGYGVTYLGYVKGSNVATSVLAYPIPVNSQTYTKCEDQRKFLDYTRFLPNQHKLAFLVQPLTYVLSITTFRLSNMLVLGFFEPGFILLMSTFLFLLFFKVLYKEFKATTGILLWVTLAYIAIFYYSVATVYWYLIPVFPVIPLSFVILLDKVAAKLNRPLLYLTIFFGLYYLLCFLPLISLYKERWFIKDETSLQTQDINEFELNKKLDELTVDSYVYRADFVGTSYLKRPYKVLPNSYFFYDITEEQFPSAKKTLADSKVNYFILLPGVTFDAKYTQCMYKDRQTMRTFLDKHAHILYQTRRGELLYELNQN